MTLLMFAKISIVIFVNTFYDFNHHVLFIERTVKINAFRMSSRCCWFWLEVAVGTS